MAGKLRLGLFGGSFDPVHNGHMQLAVAAQKECALNKVIFIPAWQPPHKARTLAPAKDRVKMLKLAIAPYPDFRISGFELKRKKTTFTYQTVEHFHSLYPAAKLFFLLGTDSLAELGTWKNIDILASLCTFIAGKRKGVSLKKPASLAPAVHILRKPIAPVSSTQIREYVIRGRPIKGLVPQPVYEYILHHGLYR